MGSLVEKVNDVGEFLSRGIHIIDNLISTSAVSPLSARQGKVLNDKITDTNSNLSDLADSIGDAEDLPNPLVSTNENVAEIYTNLTNYLPCFKRRLLLGGVSSLSANTIYPFTFGNLSDYDAVEVILINANGKRVQSQIIHKDNFNVGQGDNNMFSFYNSSSYNMHVEFGFLTNNSVKVSTYHTTGWTKFGLYVIGLG